MTLIPPPGLPRTRLLELIDEPKPAPVTLITAPAGYGKTTIAQQWIAHHPERAYGWQQIRAEHNSIGTFLAQLWRAIDVASGEDVASDEPTLERVLERLRRLVAPIVLVLDDYHLIENELIHRFVGQLIADLPETTQIVMLSRTVPELPLARMRAYGRVRQLTQDDLAFRFEEVKQIFAGTGVSDDLLQRLTQRSEGWIAGIQLALASVDLDRGHVSEQLNRVIAAMSRDRLLNDYIVQEVLDTLPEVLRRFVQDTVYLDSLDAELCDAVLEIDRSEELLERIENAIVFVGRPGGVGAPLTYHRLFAECVQRLRQRSGMEPSGRELRLRAAAWYRGRGELEVAAEYALDAEAWEEAAEILEAFIPQGLMHGNTSDALFWLRQLPESTLRKHVQLFQCFVNASIAGGEIDEARSPVESFQRTMGEELTRDQQGWLANMRTFIAYADGDWDEALHQGYQALSLLPWEDASSRLLAWAEIYREKCARGQRELAQAALRQAELNHERQKRASNYWHFLVARDIANDAAMRGDLVGAEDLNLHFMSQIPPHYSRSSLSVFRCKLLAIYVEQNRLDLAAPEVETILRDLDEHIYSLSFSGALVAIANYYLAIGDHQRARNNLDRAIQATRKHGGRDLILKAETGLVTCWLQAGQNELARFWAEGAPLDPSLVRVFGESEPRALRAQVLYRQGRHAEAMELLRQSIALAQRCGNVWVELSLSVWASVVARAMGAADEADGYLRGALELGAPGGFVRVYASTDVDLSAEIRTLLPTLSDVVGVHARSLIGEPATDEDASGRVPGHDARLTSREREVLAELVEGKSNREIAEALFISERTVKKHLASLFQKSGASNRMMLALWAQKQKAG